MNGVVNSVQGRPLIVIGSMWSAVHPRATERLAQIFEIYEFDLLRVNRSIAQLQGRTVDAAIIRTDWLDAVAPHVLALEDAGTSIRHIIATEPRGNLIPRSQIDALGVCGIIAEAGEHQQVVSEIRRILSECTCGPGASHFYSKLKLQYAALGRTDLTTVENEILQLVALGLTNEEIAEALHYSLQTIRNKLSHLMKSAGARNRTELTCIWRRFTMVADLERSNRSIVRAGD